MTGWADVGGGLAALVATAVSSSVLFTFADREITESSGLVDAGGVVYTVNDSGSEAVLYGVDAATGATASRTTWTGDAVVDVEALAPGPATTVWVGDVGDNRAARDSVAVYRVRPGTDGSSRLDLAYPDGPRDAETLLAHPRTGRLFVVSKSVFGGAVYAVPRSARPGAVTTMRRFARVSGLVTDGAFLPDGRHVLLRGYSTATVYTFPGFQATGSVQLPSQRQGEAVAVGRDGRVLLSSEGVRSDVLELRLPARLLGSVPSPGTTESSGPATPGSNGTDRPDASEGGSRASRGGMWSHPLAAAARVAMGVVMLVALGWWWWRLRR